jgi:uncharacterized protein YbjT (DUF2867 family)
MKVLVIGATGATGKHAVAKLLARGDDVTALARDPSAVTVKSDHLRVVKGEARDAGTIDRAVEGQDALLVAFGPRALKKDDLQEALMQNVIAAMKKHGVRRVVNLSAWGAGESAATSGLLFKVLRATMLRHVYVDKEKADALLLASGLDYVNVRPGQLIDTPARGGVKAGDGEGLKAKMTREDLAAFMVEQLSNDAWVGKSPVIGY